MRRITALILVLVAMATAAVLPLAATAHHGGVHGNGPAACGRCSGTRVIAEGPERGLSFGRPRAARFPFCSYSTSA